MSACAMLGWLAFGILGFVVLGCYPFRYEGDMRQMSLSWRRAHYKGGSSCR